MAERGEHGIGRMAEPLEIVAAIEGLLAKPKAARPLAGKRVIVTSGPTHEPIDPVRYIGNRSSGKQGHAIAAAAAAAGAEVVLVSGPVALPDPAGVRVVRVETAQQMLAAVEQALPADVAIFAAAVADWRVAQMQEPEDQEIRRKAPPLGADGKSRHPRHGGEAHQQAAGAGHRLCGGNRSGHRRMRRKNSRPKAATGSWPMTSRRRPASSAATAIPCISSPLPV